MFTRAIQAIKPAIIGVLTLYLPVVGLANAGLTDRLIVKFSDNSIAQQQQLSASDLATLSNVLGQTVTHVRRSSAKRQIIRLATPVSTATAKTLSNRLATITTIESAEPDLRRFPALTPNDSDFNNQWYLFEAGGGINADNAWDTTIGDANTVVAVLDTGITIHPELSGRILGGYDFIADIDAANDGDGRDFDPSDPGDAAAADECGPGAIASNSSWHGTLISGIIAANTDNNTGIAGIDHRAMILPVRVLGKCGGFVSDIADAIRWAAGINEAGLPPGPASPAQILNLSFGASGECSQTEQEAINAAIANNVLVITAAGNDATDASGFSPGNCENVINVAASSRQGGETCYTNFGNSIDISAPGGNDSSGFCAGPATDGIYTTTNSGLTAPVDAIFGFTSGTSFAAPMVSGAAALVLAANPLLSPEQVSFTLQTSSRVFPTGTNDGFSDCTTDRCGVGLLDTAAAVEAASNNALGGQGDGFIRMGQANLCVTEGTAFVNLTVNRIGGNGIISASIETQDISATAGLDYQETQNILTWADGDTNSRTISIGINDDDVVEGSEFFRAQLSLSSVNAVIGEPMSTTVTIVSRNGSDVASCASSTTSNTNTNNNDNDGGGGAILGLLLYFSLLLFAKSVSYIKPKKQ